MKVTKYEISASQIRAKENDAIYNKLASFRCSALFVIQTKNLFLRSSLATKIKLKRVF